MSDTTINIGLIGFGWMGQGHSRSYRNIPVYFPETGIKPRLVAVADSVPERVGLALDNFGYESGTAKFAWLYRYPRLLIAASLPLGLVHAIYILSCWLRAGIYRPLLMLPLVLLSRLAYSIGMMTGGIRWLRERKAGMAPAELGATGNSP